MGFSWRKTFKTKQTRKPKCLSAFDVEHAQCLTGYHVFMVSGLDLARAPRRARLTARKKGSGYENVNSIYIYIWNDNIQSFDSFSYPEPFLRAVNGRRRGALAKSISNWHLIGYNEGYCSNNVYIFYHVFMVSGFGFGQSPSSHRA